MPLKSLIDVFSKAPQKRAFDTSSLPVEPVAEQRDFVAHILELQSIATIEQLYQQSLTQWRTDWQRALCEVMCKLEPASDRRLIMWLSACISNGDENDAVALHRFIENLPLNDHDRLLWTDVNVHFALMKDQPKEAERHLAMLENLDPNYSSVWAKIAVIGAHSREGRSVEVVRRVNELLELTSTPVEAVPNLLQCLSHVSADEEVVTYGLRVWHQGESLEPRATGICAGSLVSLGRLDLCVTYLRAHQDALPLAPQAWFALRECALKLDEYANLQDLLKTSTATGQRDLQSFQKGLMAIDQSDLPEARRILEEFEDPDGELALQLSLILATEGKNQDTIKATYAKFLDAGHPRHPAVQIYAGNLLGQAQSQSDLERALAVTETMPENERTAADIANLQLKLFISLNKETEAVERFAEASKSLKQTARLRAEQWIRWHGGDNPGALRASQSVAARSEERSIHNLSALPHVHTFSYDPNIHHVLCFSCVYNGMDFLPWFLSYYRGLGIDHFFLVDNASNDGTTAFLERQPDVSLFTATGSFRQSAHGVFWVNDLMKTYALDKWAFFVDMDEAFVFPLMDQGRSLSDLLAYLEANGYGCTPSLMVDMFAIGSQGGDIAENCFFDNSYLSYGIERPPYTATQGGFRTRLTGRNLLITKSPLAKVGPTFSYLQNNHYHTHLQPADISTALLHYKFVGSIDDRIDDAIARKEHFQGATFYKELKKAIRRPETADADPFQSAKETLRYERAQDLLDANVMRSSKAWDEFVQDTTST